MFKVLVLCFVSMAYAFPFFNWNQQNAQQGSWWPQFGFNQWQAPQQQSQNVVPVIIVLTDPDYEGSGSGNDTSADYQGSGESAEIIVDYVQPDYGSGMDYPNTSDNSTTSSSSSSNDYGNNNSYNNY